MARRPRLDVPGALHHIMVRGINRADIFTDDQDRTKFLEKLGENVTAGKCAVYAWTLMNNHVHILFRSGEKGISAIMRKLLTWYAIYFNRKYKRTGHLFENRYKSILCEEEGYLLALIRYIHLNPVRAHIISDIESLDHYPWSGHSTIMGYTSHEWMDKEYVLAQFGVKRKRAHTAYRRFIEEGFTMGQRPELVGGGLIRSLGGWSQVVSMKRKDQKTESDERILGGSSFVSAILKEAEEKQLRQMKFKTSGKSIQHIIEKECIKRQVSLDELQSGGRRHKVSQTRAVIAYMATIELGLSAAEIARHLGVNTSSISRSVKKVEKKGID